MVIDKIIGSGLNLLLDIDRSDKPRFVTPKYKRLIGMKPTSSSKNTSLTHYQIIRVKSLSNRNSRLDMFVCLIIHDLKIVILVSKNRIWLPFDG